MQCKYGCLDTWMHIHLIGMTFQATSKTPLISANDLHCISVLMHSRWLSHTPYITLLSHHLRTIFQWLINISSFHTLVLCCLHYPSTFLHLFLHLFNLFEILQINVITHFAPTQFNSLSSTMMSIWTRWLELCLIGLSTSLQKIITVSKYSPPLITIVGTLSECRSIIVIFACRCLYYHSTGHQWEWEKIDDHNLLLIYSYCLLIEKLHICCYLLDLHDFLISSLDMVLRELLGILGLPSR